MLNQIDNIRRFPEGFIKFCTFHSIVEIEKWAQKQECWYFQQIAYKQETYLAAIKTIQTTGE